MGGDARSLIRIRWAGAGVPEAETCYEIAGCEVRSNRPVAELEPFRAAGRPGGSAGAASASRAGLDAPVVYDGRGWIGGRDVRVVCRAEASRYRLEVEDGVVIAVGPSAGARQIDADGEVGDRGTRTTVLGPGLALALALDGCFSLHAGAFVRAGRAVAVLGGSGAGKSTLAAAAEARRSGARLADDVLPFTIGSDGRMRAHPRFPQLKLGPASQWLGAEKLEVAEVLFLERQPALSEPVRTRLGPSRSVLRLVENTVASRLFAAELKVAHLDAAVAAAGTVPVYDLSIPDRLDLVPETVRYLASRP